MRRRIPVAALVALLAAAPAVGAETVPLVGCAADGQLGELPPPAFARRPVAVRSELAGGLAWYQAAIGDGVGVLAPRGWDCYAVYGSSGETLTVAPRVEHRLDAPRLAGPAVVLRRLFGDTSGALSVAGYLSRLWPEEGRRFIAAEVTPRDPSARYATRPYPDDRLTIRDGFLVLFETPADKQGLGSIAPLAPGPRSVGFVQYEPASKLLTHLYLRLPPEHAPLEAAIRDDALARRGQP